LKRINKEFEVEHVRRLMVEMQVIFDIKESEINTATKLKEEPQTVLKEVLSLLRIKAGVFKDKIAVLVENKELLMKESIAYEVQVKEFNAQVVSLRNQIATAVDEAI
jgi:hypothetical protein